MPELISVVKAEYHVHRHRNWTRDAENDGSGRSSPGKASEHWFEVKKVEDFSTADVHKTVNNREKIEILILFDGNTPRQKSKTANCKLRSNIRLFRTYRWSNSCIWRFVFSNERKLC
jgi:hypothetical protein